jgi:site-specific DNA-methyltransferase (adenine-specific)
MGNVGALRDGRPEGHNDAGGASRFFTRFHYSAKASRSERELGLLGHIPCLKCGQLDSVTHINPKTGKEEKCRRNGHPTVKPLDVCRWLCRLTKTPTGGVVLDPFMGSGRIPMAAVLEGREAIGIELERPSFEIARWVVAWAEEQVPEMVQAEFVT